jgi:FAD synthase
MSSVDYSGATVLAPPLLMSGPVVKGFGRGSKELGIPTANLDAAALPEAATCHTGVYYGWASVGSSPRVYQMVMSIGW